MTLLLILISLASPLKAELIADYYESKPLTSQNVLMAINDLEIQHKTAVFIHLRRESGNFRSKIAIENNNIAGMKRAKHRFHYAIAERNLYAVYHHWIYCLLD